MKWRRFSCGAVTDTDEDQCPRHGPLWYKPRPKPRQGFWSKLLGRIRNLLKEGNPHTDFCYERCLFQDVELSGEELLVEHGENNIYTKHIAQLEDFIKELRQKQKEAH